MALPPTRPGGPFRPTRLGQWEVIAKIAGGGMSAVYLGRRVEPAPDIPNVVALKIARHELRLDERMLAMFLAEGRLIARLVHPNIVRTLEVGGDAELDFIAMELMLGKTFASIYDAITAREVRLSPEIVAWTAARIADALHYAHELADESGRPLGLVHRDVNPANVFATFHGEVKLFDFGLAKVTAKDASGSHLLAGKLSYLSPEQIMQMPLDRRSDVFSLGTTLWELLTGKRLFRRDDDFDTVRAVQLGPIPDPRSVAPEVPEELARIAKMALERNREHRYPTAATFARELDAFVYKRSSAAEVSARLAQLVDTLFPGEQKRQAGWLKPAISSSPSRQMGAVAPPSSGMATPLDARPPYSRPSPPTPAPVGPRDTTAVMPNAPLRAPKPPAIYADVDAEVDTELRDSNPGPMTPRDGISFAETIADSGPLLASLADRVGLGPPTEEVATFPAFADDPPLSSTKTQVSAVPPPKPSEPRPGSKANRPPSLAAPPPLPQRSRPPPLPAPAPSVRPGAPRSQAASAPPTKASAPPPLPPLRASDEDLSKTELQLVPSQLAEQRSAQFPARPKRAPIPLPSKSVPPRPSPTSVAPRPGAAPRKATTEPPPSSDTQVDRHPPPKKR